MRREVNYHPLNSIYGSYEEESVRYLYTKFEADNILTAIFQVNLD